VPDRILPLRSNLEQYRKQAKELLRAARSSETAALARIHQHHPRYRDLDPETTRTLALSDAQLTIAREHGYPSWPAFARHVETQFILRSVEVVDDPLSAFIEVACVDRRGSHGSGTLEHADAIVARYPEVATASIYSAAVLANESALCDWLKGDPSLATAKGGPHGWDALTYLCFSRYLRIDKYRSKSFVACARALLESGASANTGWVDHIDKPPRPVAEPVIYGAAALAQNPKLTQLLLDYGADPNDEETPYHVAGTYDNTVLTVLLAARCFNERSLATVAVRKCDWHDDKGLKLVLEHGSNPNYLTAWKYSPFHQSIRRDNGLIMIELLLDYGADPMLANRQDGLNGVQMAACHGRGDILDALDRRGLNTRLDGFDALVAACARAQPEAAQSISQRSPELLAQLQALGGTLLARFSGAGNDSGIAVLLALGISPNALWLHGDGYWELAPGSTALHVAAWRANHQTVRTLIAAGTEVNARDARDRTALQLAIRACIDSYWQYRRQPDSVAALLDGGATLEGIELPTGYDAIDELLIPRARKK
jgi:ankyrin repeat protein